MKRTSNQPRSALVIYLLDTEHAELKRRAHAQGLTVSNLVRVALAFPTVKRGQRADLPPPDLRTPVEREKARSIWNALDDLDDATREKRARLALTTSLPVSRIMRGEYDGMDA